MHKYIQSMYPAAYAFETRSSSDKQGNALTTHACWLSASAVDLFSSHVFFCRLGYAQPSVAPLLKVLTAAGTLSQHVLSLQMLVSSFLQLLKAKIHELLETVHT